MRAVTPTNEAVCIAAGALGATDGIRASLLLRIGLGRSEIEIARTVATGAALTTLGVDLMSIAAGLVSGSVGTLIAALLRNGFAGAAGAALP